MWSTNWCADLPDWDFLLNPAIWWCYRDSRFLTNSAIWWCYRDSRFHVSYLAKSKKYIRQTVVYFSALVSQTFVAAVNVYPLTLGRRAEKRAAVHAKCQLLPT